nr:filamentous hemagglutinin N-terminal domain-containing protein [Phormidium tenue]
MAGATPLAQAQVTPDDTLGSEASTVTPDVLVRGSEADLIEGGALRGSNLFHSFLEFNVDPGQRLYFANPAGVESILSRITGNNPSAIFGTLGVDGAADLFLINPNGLVFGETATLDIQGSFYASTAEAISMGDGVYSATAPEQSSLLTVNPSALFSNYLSESSGNIESRALLAAGENLTLAANQLDLQRQVAAGGDLTLLGNTVQIRDAVNAPFVGFAGGDLLVQGNEQVDIVALSHPDSGLYSYGDMVLRSQNPVGGDAHYWSGGNFTVETLNGSGGSLYSPIDPIIRSRGDVSFDTYVGSSLHILAGGSVALGTALITAPDPGVLGNDFLRETIRLSDGTVVEVDGGAQPTLDVRAGVSLEMFGTAPLELITGLGDTDIFLGALLPTNSPSSAEITIGDVFINAPNGLVLLTNQYQPNNTLTEGNINITGEGFFGNGINTSRANEQGGTVYLDARNNILVTNSFIDTTSTGAVGNIVINAADTILFDGADGSGVTGVFANLVAGGEGTGGNVRINANNLEISNGAQITALVFGDGQGGDVKFNIRDTVRLIGSNPINGIAGGVFSGIAPNGEGGGGNIQIAARNLEIIDGAVLSASTFGLGNAGSVNLTLTEQVHIAGSSPISGFPSSILSSVEPTGQGTGGGIQINTKNLNIVDGARIGTGVFGTGDAGDIFLTVAEIAQIAGFDTVSGRSSGIFSSVDPTGVGNGGNIRLTAANVQVLDGAQLNTSSSGLGNAGNVILNGANLIRFARFNPILGNVSGAFSNIESTGEGTGGNVQISGQVLEVLDGAELSASTFGIGDAGSVILNISDLTRFEGTRIGGFSSGAFSRVESAGVGSGGNVEITTRTIEVLNGALLDASTFGLGNAGSVTLNVAGLARFSGSNPIAGIASGASSSVQPTGIGTGGNLQITAGTLDISGGATLSASTLGIGNAGSVILNIAELARFAGFDPVDSSPSGAFSRIEFGGEGEGGNVQITAHILKMEDGAQISVSTIGAGNAGSLSLNVSELVQFIGFNSIDNTPSGVFSSVEPTGNGNGGNVEITTRNLEVLNGAQIGNSTFGIGNAGNVNLRVSELARFVGSSQSTGVFSIVEPAGIGTGGDIELSAKNVEILQNAALDSSSIGDGNAGNIVLLVSEQLLIDNGTILTSSESFTGGQITIQSGYIILRNDGDIQTFVSQGEGGGGNIAIASNFLIALEDSDILAFSADGRGGVIDLSRTTFFGQNPSIAARNLSRNELLDLDGNDRVDINATGGIESGQIFVGDATFVENSLTALTDAIVDTSALTAGSCIARSQDSLGSFVVTGRDGLPATPGDGGISAYPTGTVRALDEPAATSLQEPDGVYQLPSGRLVLSRACD